jgi:hypothetical protein
MAWVLVLLVLADARAGMQLSSARCLPSID